MATNQLNNASYKEALATLELIAAAMQHLSKFIEEAEQREVENDGN